MFTGNKNVCCSCNQFIPNPSKLRAHCCLLSKQGDNKHLSAKPSTGHERHDGASGSHSSWAEIGTRNTDRHGTCREKFRCSVALSQAGMRRRPWLSPSPFRRKTRFLAAHSLRITSPTKATIPIVESGQASSPHIHHVKIVRRIESTPTTGRNGAIHLAN